MRKSLIAIATTFILLSLAPFAFADEASSSSSAKPVININTADAAQFALLPRIGVKAGERIVAYRSENGAFKKTTDLMQVKGVGDKTFELLSPYLTLEGKTTLASKQQGPRKPRASKGAKAGAREAASNTAQ